MQLDGIYVPWGGKWDDYTKLIAHCNHALYDFRYKLNSGSGASPTRIFVPQEQPANTLGSPTTFPRWELDYHRISALINSNQYFFLNTNIADAQAECFIIARVRFRGTEGAHIVGRGRDGSGAGWSMQCGFNSSAADFAVVTTSGGAAGRSVNDGTARIPGQWYTYIAAYKSGSYIKVGVDGIWTATTAFTATGLRNSSQGLSLNRNNSASATGDMDLRIVGMGTAIPTDAEILALHEEILELEREPLDSFDPLDMNSTLLSSIGVGGGSTPAPSNIIWF